MPVEYRLLRGAEVDSAADLWVVYGPGIESAQHQAWRREFRSIPHLLTHTRVAVGVDGALLSIIHYWPLQVHDASGAPRRVGRVSHVFTREDARRQGHATRLLELTLAAMRDDGRQWSILSASEEGRPLYERYGWRPLPYRRVRCVGVVPERVAPSAGRYSVRPYDPRREPDGWGAIERIHRAYNAGRPFTVVRDDAYWRNVAARVDWWMSPSSSSSRTDMLVAVRDDDAPRAYALALFFEERGFLLAELGALPGEEDALRALLAFVVAQPGGRAAGGRLYLPREPALEAALAELCSEVTDGENDECMARIIAPDVDQEVMLAALPTAPGNVMWLLDDM